MAENELLNQIRAKAAQKKKTIVLPESHDERVLKAAEILTNDLSKKGSYKVSVKNLDVDASNSITFKVISRIEAVDSLINKLNNLCPGIKNKGLCNSLMKKLENARKDLEKNNLSAAKGKLQAFQNELNAQRAKGVSESAYKELYNYSELIIKTIN